MKAEKLIRLDNASEFYIKTPMGKLLHNTLEQWIWCGLTGGVQWRRNSRFPGQFGGS